MNFYRRCMLFVLTTTLSGMVLYGCSGVLRRSVRDGVFGYLSGNVGDTLNNGQFSNFVTDVLNGGLFSPNGPSNGT